MQTNPTEIKIRHLKAQIIRMETELEFKLHHDKEFEEVKTLYMQIKQLKSELSLLNNSNNLKEKQY